MLADYFSKERNRILNLQIETMKTKKKTQVKPPSSKVCYADSDEIREEYKEEVTEEKDQKKASK